MRHPGQTFWMRTDTESGFFAQMFLLPLRWWERLWYRIRPWEGCRVYWGSHGCDRRRGHRWRHRCGGLLRDRCCYGYDAPPWWAPWRPDTTQYFVDDAPDGWPARGTFRIFDGPGPGP